MKPRHNLPNTTDVTASREEFERGCHRDVVIDQLLHDCVVDAANRVGCVCQNINSAFDGNADTLQVGGMSEDQLAMAMTLGDGGLRYPEGAYGRCCPGSGTSR